MGIGIGHFGPEEGHPQVLYPSHLWVTVPGRCALTRPHFFPSYLSQCGLFFISLVVEKSFLLVFRSFSEIVVLYVVVVLVCLGMEVYSGSSYSTILIWPLPDFLMMPWHTKSFHLYIFTLLVNDFVIIACIAFF